MTHVLHPESATSRARSTTPRDPFFVVTSAVTLLVVIGGFAPTLYLRPVFQPVPIPAYLFFHGIVLTTWFVWLFVQSLLIRSGRTALHRRIGVAGGVLAVIVPFAGLLATSRVVGRATDAGINLNADASAYGIGVSGPVVLFLADVIWQNLGAAITFAALAWSGIWLRRRAATHKRLMLIATVSILGPALARLARVPILGGEQGPFTPVVLLALLAAIVVHDIVTLKKIHPATVWGIAFALGVNLVARSIATTATGMAFVRWLR